MRYIRAFLLLVLLAVPTFSWAQVSVTSKTAYNPCEHLADLYHSKSNAEYQGIVESCTSAKTTADVIQDKTQTAKNVAEVAKGVGQGVGEAAKGIGGAVGDLAKNLGVTANEFIRSPAGALLAFVLVIKFVGAKMFAIPFVMFIVLVWWRAVNGISRDVEYEFVPVFWGLFKFRRISKITRHFNDDEQVFALLSGLGGGLLCLIVTLAL